ncbi:MAG: glycosyltransferase family 4 protein [Desulfobacteraceae bacterium]|nr:glycosyltransferase family 4 protein [Desulfobacteraceae bacterium]MBC2750817.1 glycosyltransferase family 4 protein [Desulfobacteraceae bacterium]
MKRRAEIKIGVLCLPGLQSFLKDIVGHLSSRYRVRTCYSVIPQQIQETIQWADVVWLEWANELTIGITKNQELLNGKKVICRLHSYEAFEDYLQKIDWRKIDDLVFVAAHIQEIAINHFPALADQVRRMQILPNGIDIDRFAFSRRNRGYHLAFIGDINYKKGPMLLLHAFRELVQVENRYTLHMAGRLQNARYALYYSQMIKEMDLEANIQMDGWVNDIQSWLVNKQYVVCSSVLEGHPVGIMEAMACGLKPVIHNFVGARGIYPDGFLWNTIPGFIQQVTSEDYDSDTYRDFIKNNFSLKSQLEKIDRLIVEPRRV